MRRATSTVRMQGTVRTTTLTLVTLVALVLGLGACSSSPRTPEAQPIEKGTPYGDLLVPKLQASVADGDIGVTVEEPVTVSVEAGVLGEVTLVNAQGRMVAGELSADGVSWRSAEPLGYNKEYTLNADALGLGGVTHTSATFETHSPQNLTMPYVMPDDGAVVGVGQPISVTFDEVIPDRLAAQRAVTVTTTPEVEGAFYWLSGREMRWRPAQYWKPGTKVDVRVNTYGVDLGDGLFGQDDVTTGFTIGDEVIATADDATKTLTVRVNGEVAKSMPIDGQGQHADRQRHLYRGRTPCGHGDGFLDLRGCGELTRRVSHRGQVGHPDVLQWDLRARGTLVGRQSGPHQCQPRLPQREHREREMVLRQHQTR